MITACLILNILTLLGLCLAGCIYFKEKYTIVTIEQWNKIATIHNIAITSGLMTEDGEINETVVSPNIGFFKEQLEDGTYEEEEE
ncbi:MAG: hypothetical protein J6Y02_13185 [Pseudobutyrivibrio sp.]|nr:hypothetical protein [Pseudobutyrivibrio sp.]